MHFDWEKYREETGCATVSADQLSHHAALHSSHVAPGVLCEVRTRGADMEGGGTHVYWLGVVRLVCEPLVEISYLVPPSAESEAGDSWRLEAGHWVDTAQLGLYRYGHSRDAGARLRPPGAEVSCEADWYARCEAAGLLSRHTPLSVSFPPGAGLSLASHVKPGRQVKCYIVRLLYA